MRAPRLEFPWPQFEPGLLTEGGDKMGATAPEMLALQRLYHWEKTSPQRVAFTQPMGDGTLRDMTWGEVAC